MDHPAAVWNHNNHYQPFLLAQVPLGCAAALDIGCGRGEFAGRLASICVAVDAIDPDPVAIAYARRTCASLPNITFHHSSLDDCPLLLGHYDYVSAVASLHHLDLVPALERIKCLVRPGGILAILGLYKEATLNDWMHSALAAPVHLAYSYVYRSRGAEPEPRMATRPPEETLREIRTAMDAILPGHRFRRRLLWRYSVVWNKPA
jgi:SAM-dependent methyltransferase